MNANIDAYADQIKTLADKIKAENAASRPPIDRPPIIDRPPVVPPDPGALPPGAHELIYVTEFDTPDEWDQTMGAPGIPGVYKHGDWMMPGYPEQITIAACEPGAPGRGQRHWTGPGVNAGSGGLRIEPFSGQRRGEFWINLRMRYQPGLKFSQYHKVMYFAVASPQAAIAQFLGSGVNIWSNAAGNHNASSSGGFGSVNPYDWFDFLVHLKTDTNGADGIGEISLDGDQVLNERAVNYGGATWDGFASQENMSDRAGTDAMYVDVSSVRVWI